MKTPRDAGARALVPLAAGLLLSGIVVSSPALGERTAATSSRAVVKVAYNKTLKKAIVVDASGRTLYMFTEDKGGPVKICTAQGPYGRECPTIWPPLTSQVTPQAGKGIDASKLGTTKRVDGKRQATYNGHPLYYFHGEPGIVGDKKPGEARGEGFVGEWYVLSPKGTPILP